MNNQSAAGVLMAEIRLGFCRRWMVFIVINDIHNYACVDCTFHGLSKLPGGVKKAYLLGLHEWEGPLSENLISF